MTPPDAPALCFAGEAFDTLAYTLQGLKGCTVRITESDDKLCTCGAVAWTSNLHQPWCGGLKIYDVRLHDVEVVEETEGPGALLGEAYWTLIGARWAGAHAEAVAPQTEVRLKLHEITQIYVY